MKVKSIVILAAFVFSISAQEQVDVSGIVLTRDSTPISDVMVTLAKKGMSDTTSPSGLFSIKTENTAVQPLSGQFGGQCKVRIRNNRIFISLSDAELVRLTLYDIKGCVLSVICNAILGKGNHALLLPAGLYSSQYAIISGQIGKEKVCTGFIPSAGFFRRGAITSVDGPLSKTAAGAVDTLIVTHAIYQGTKVPLDTYAKQLVIVLGCDSTPDTINERENFISYTVGRQWLYKKYFIFNGAVPMGLPPGGALLGYSHFWVAKDTVIGQAPYFIIEGRDYEIDKDSISTFSKRCAVCVTQAGLKVYEFQGEGYGFLSGIFKRNREVRRLVFTSAMSARDLRKAVLQKVLAAAAYDTTLFCDLYYPIIFPLLRDTSWWYREPGDPRGNLPLRKAYLGKEIINVPAGRFLCLKMEWRINEMLKFGGIDSTNLLYGYDWFGPPGLVKRWYDYGRSTMTNDTGDSIGTFHSWDRYEYLGEYSINPDTLKPWGL
jgi:hypothetical protein